MVSLAKLSDTPVPLGSIRVGYLNSGVDSTCSTIGPLGALYNSWSQLFKFPVADLAPNITDSSRENRAFRVRAGTWNHGLDTIKEHTSHHLGHCAHTSSSFRPSSLSLVNCRVICSRIVELVIVNKQTDGLFKLTHIRVFQLCFISRLNLRLLRFLCLLFALFFGLLCFSFFLVLFSSRTILSPLDMRLRVPVHVQTISTIRLEEKFLEVCLKLSFSKAFKHGDLRILSIELITMSTELIGPEANEFLIQVLIFL